MKLIQLTIGAVFSYLGYQGLTAESPKNIGWLLLLIGVVLILKSLSNGRNSSVSRTSRGSSGSGGFIGSSDSNCSGGGDCGGGGE